MCLVYLFVFRKNFQFYFTFFKTPEGGSVVWLVPLLPYPFGAPFILCYVYPLKVSDEFVHNKLEWWLNVFHHFFFPGFLNEASEEVSILENLVRWKSILHLNNVCMTYSSIKTIVKFFSKPGTNSQEGTHLCTVHLLMN